MSPIRPLHDRLVVRPRVRKVSDIIYVENREKHNEGTIMAIGPGVLTAKVGEFIKYGNGTYLDWPIYHFDGQDFQIIQEADICCIVDN